MEYITKDDLKNGGRYEHPILNGIYANIHGELISTRRNYLGGYKYLKHNKDHQGYLYIHYKLNGKGKNIKSHRIIAEAILGLSNGLCVNHKNGIKDDNKISNLEWVTHSENIKHRYRELGQKVSHNSRRHLIDNKKYYLAIAKKGPGHNRSKAIFMDGERFDNVKSLANELGCSMGLISMAANGRIFKRGILKLRNIYFETNNND